MSRADGSTPRFVIGTGRCGSTLLAKMLSRHPRLLVLDEVFAGIDGDRAFAPTPMSGERFCELLLEERRIIEFIRSRYHALVKAGAPVLAKYPDGLPGLPFLSGSESIPPMCIWIAGAAVKMNVNVYAFASKATRFLRKLPPQLPGQLYLTFFDWLAQQSNSAMGWCERTGPSLELLDELSRAFPTGRFLHLHRDGLYTALSMQTHPLFALMVSLLNHPLSPEEAQIAARPTADGIPDPVVRRLTKHAPSAEECGQYWSSVVVRGMQAAARLDKDRYMEVRYEDLVQDPERTLTGVAAFFDLDDVAWIGDAAALVDRSRPVKRPATLTAEALAALEAACEPGQRALGRA